MRRSLVSSLVLSLALLPACGGGPRTTGSSAAIAGWTDGEGEDTRPSSQVLGESGPPAEEAPRSRTIGGTRREPIVRRGALVDVRFEGAALREAMRLLAEVAQLDLVVEGDVAGTVSLDLRDVRPLDAMRAIAAAHGAEVEVSGRLVVVRAAR